MPMTEKEIKIVLTDLLVLFGPNGERWTNHCPLDEENCDCIVTGIYHLTANNNNDFHEVTLFIYDHANIQNESLGSWNDRHSFQEVKELISSLL